VTLPEGWAAATIADIADTRLGKMLDTAKNKGVSVPYLRNVNVRWGKFDLSDLFDMRVTSDEYSELAVQDGDLFVCEGGDPGRSAVWREGPQRIVFQKALHRIRPLGGVEADFIARYLKHAVESDALAHLLTGTTIRHLPQVALQRIEVNVPPKAEQRRIVAKVDLITARIARARAELDRASRLSVRMRQTMLAQIFGIKIEQHWSALKDIGLAVEAGKNLKCDERPPHFNEAGVVKVSAVSGEVFRPDESKTLPSDYSAPERDRIHTGDLLLARASGSLRLVGRVAVVKGEPRNLFLSDKVLRLRLPPEISDWVHWFLRSPVGRSQIEDAASGISMHNITQGSLMGLRLPVPDVKSRRAALHIINAAFARADRLEAEAARARALLDRLESAILAKAFRGELVPQDPNDEPASVLLDRIRAERAAAPKISQGRKKKEIIS